MRQTEFYIAIIGAISKFKGFGDIIVSSQSFLRDMKQVRAISEIDKEVASFYDNYPSSYLDLFQWFGFPKKIADSNCFLIIRAKKKFTAFPEQSRFYDRREFFYFNLDNDIDSINFATSIPEMVQYETEQLGQLDNFLIKEAKYSIDEKFHKYIITSLLIESAAIIKVTVNNADETKDKILGAIKRLPISYRKYLGFGFNIETNTTFVKNNLHFLTTLDNNGVEVNNLSNLKIKDNELNDFAEALLTEQIQYDDTEILLLNFPLNRNTLYELIKFHKLHFKTDKYSQGNIPENRKQEFLSETKQYVSDFLTSSFATKPYILRRIIKIYKAWDFNGLLDINLFIGFWKKVNEAKIPHEKLFNDNDIKRSINETIQLEISGINTFNEIDSKFTSLISFPSFNIAKASLLDEIKIKYINSYKGNIIREVKEIEAYKQQATKSGIKTVFQNNFYAKVDFDSQKSNLSKSESFDILKNEIDNLGDAQIFSLIKAIGLGEMFNLLIIEKSEKILRNRNFYEPTMELLIQQNNLTEILKWVSLFNENNSNASFDTGKYLNNQAAKIISRSDYSYFEILCSVIRENKSKILIKTANEFIEKVISQPNCQTFQFYKTSFEFASSFGFKITATHPNSKSENDLLNFSSLYNKNRNTIKNDTIITEVAESFLKLYTQSNRSIDEILDFSYDNQLFIESNKDKFQFIVEDFFSKQNKDNKRTSILSLFRHAIQKEKNLFLHKGKELYRQILDIETNDKQFIKEIHQLGLRIVKKNNQLNEVESLINQIIDKYFSYIDNNAKFLTKMRNKISFINMCTKILCAILFVALVVTIGVGSYYYKQNNKLLEHAVKENDALKEENKKLKDNVFITENVTTDSNVILFLSPIPNNELNDNDQKLVSRQGIQNKTVSEVVEIIFEKNNTDIKTHYNEQKETYATALIKANPNCFKNGVCMCTLLKHIPSYKN